METLPTSNVDSSSYIEALTLPSRLLSDRSFNNHSTSNMKASPSTSTEVYVADYLTSAATRGAETSNPDASFSTDNFKSTETHGIETSTFAAPSSTNYFNSTATHGACVSTSTVSYSAATFIHDERRQTTAQRSAHPKGAPRCSPINANAVGISRSPRPSELHRRKNLNDGLNHVGFLATVQFPEEHINLQEKFTSEEEGTQITSRSS